MCSRLLLPVLCLLAFGHAQVNLNPTSIALASIIVPATDSVSFVIRNGSPQPVSVEDINAWDSVFSIRDTAFTIAAGDSHRVFLKYHLRHNLNYRTGVMVHSRNIQMPLMLPVYIHGEYADTYYSTTQNKSNEELKSALKTRLAAGYISLGYNTARDSMYMSIDNQRVNGAGATQNTLECVYTGQTAVGYTSRADCQTNYGFDTEHTYPQSLFSSNEPMKSDLFHIFPTKSTANNERGNKPFNYVTAPTWSVGGSLSNATYFEPRNSHKGRVARAMLYFVLRYQDYTGYCAPQETVLRQWHSMFPPDLTDSLRNADVFSMQHNKNPLIDHPEFLERISSVCTVDSGFRGALQFRSQDTLYILTGAASGQLVQVHFSNEGTRTLQVTSISGSTGAIVPGVTSFTLSADSLYSLNVTVTTPLSGVIGSVRWASNDASLASDSVIVVVQPIVGLDDTDIPQLTVFPNPTSGVFTIAGFHTGEIEIVDLSGRIVHHIDEITATGGRIEWTSAIPGMYLLKLSHDGHTYNGKLIVTHE